MMSRLLYYITLNIVFCCRYSDSWRRKNATVVCSSASEIRYKLLYCCFYYSSAHPR